MGIYFDEDYFAEGVRLINTISRFPKPTIAMINGAAAGAGASWSLACDFRFMEPSSKFIMAFLNIGLSGDTEGIYNLGQLVGAGILKKIIMTGKPLSGEDCEKYGIAELMESEHDKNDKNKTLRPTGD